MEEYIYFKNNILDDILINEIITYFEKSQEKYEGIVGAKNEVNKNIKKCMECNIIPDLIKNIIKNIDPIINEYINKYIINNNNLGYTNFKIKKYEKNIDFFKKHCDISAFKNSSRHLAIIIYLNDVYEGGETVIYKNNTKEILLKYKPKKGSILLFPTNFCFYHSGEIPISNDKFIINGFLSYY